MKTHFLFTILAVMCLTAASAQNITTNPVTATVCSGASASFTVAATSVTSYQWQAYSNGAWANIGDTGGYSGTNAAQLGISNTAGRDSFLYRCVITEPSTMTDTSNAAVLNALTPPSVVIQPNVTAACPQTFVTFSVAASSRNLSYQWQADNGSGFINLVNSGAYSGASNSILLLDSSIVNSTIGGSVFRSFVSNGCGVADTSQPAQLSIFARPQAASIASSGINNVICQGDSMQFMASVDPALSYQWELNGANVAGATDTSYYAGKGGDYSVRVTNSDGCSNVSSTESLVVNPLPAAIITGNSTVDICAGNAQELVADTSGSITSYYWIRNGVADSLHPGYIYQAAHSGTYVISTANKYGCMNYSAPVSVIEHALPQAVITQTDNTLSTGSFASYQWFRNGTVIAGATGDNYTVTSIGMYTVRVTDTYGCPGMSDVTTITALGVNAFGTAGNLIHIYPNPTTGMLHVAGNTEWNAMLQNAEGRVMLAQPAGKDIDLSRYAKGIYTLTVADENGVRLAVQKVVLSN